MEKRYWNKSLAEGLGKEKFFFDPNISLGLWAKLPTSDNGNVIVFLSILSWSECNLCGSRGQAHERVPLSRVLPSQTAPMD